MLRWLLPLLILGVIAPFTPWIDLSLSGWLYAAFPWNPPFFDFLYKYGMYPANITAGIAFFLFLLSFAYSGLVPARRLCLYLSLVLALGSGAIVHGVFKDHWGRPRPRQIEEFGGTLNYRPFWKPDFFQKEPTQSFVSGHASTGFYFFAPAVAFWRYRRRKWSFFWFMFACVWGSLLGVARIAQGGHFFSDILGAAIVMWYVSIGLDLLLLKGRLQNQLP